MITEEQYRRFEGIRKQGAYNMVADLEEVIWELDMTKAEYMELLANYDDVREEYGEC